MKGKYVISVVSRKATYKLELERKVSVIKGNSGTGKTSMLRLISEYLEFGKKSGVKITIDASAALCVLTNSSDWEKILSSVHDTVIFADEDVEYIYSDSFQKELWKADCYAVIVSRSGGFTGIPYSISGIYEFVTEKKGENTTTSMYQLYEEEHSNGNFGLVITEDSNEMRIPFEVSVDPFYSRSNMEELERRIADAKAGKNMHEHELIEED